ncbi:MAG: Eco57I restriction-modification methylase domain-containing protein [Thermoplasmatota archaeon]
MIGQHPTPPGIVQRMLAMASLPKLAERGAYVLDPGCGEGAFFLPILEEYASYAATHGHPLSWVVERVRGVELDPKPLSVCREQAQHVLAEHGFQPTDADLASLVVECDFTRFEEAGFDLVIGNPPYVRLEGLAELDRRRYRRQFQSAVNRYDLYFLFFEQGLRLLASEGQLCFITPQKYAQVWSGSGLRKLLATRELRGVVILAEDAFPDLVTYPAITHLLNQRPGPKHRVQVHDERKGESRSVEQASLCESPWFCLFGESDVDEGVLTLADVCSRIGVGVATGADAVFELAPDEARMIPAEYVRPALSGRDLPAVEGEAIEPRSQMVFPYDGAGRLVPEASLGAAAEYLAMAHHRERLVKRSCHAKGSRAWYEYHERPRPKEFEGPKIVVQDIQRTPVFHIDRTGSMPKHSVYYIIPKDMDQLEVLAEYLNSEKARAWLEGHCMSAAGGHLRLQSKTLARLPVPAAFSKQRTLVSVPA